jgi:hypothetical protein
MRRFLYQISQTIEPDRFDSSCLSKVPAQDLSVIVNAYPDSQTCLINEMRMNCATLTAHHAFMTPDRWQQINRLYQAALELETSQRTAFLKEACAGDEELRREVESLLTAHEQGRSPFEGPALEVGARAVS